MSDSLADGAAYSDRALCHYQAMQTGCAVCNLGERTQIELTGSDRQRFLHNLCTNDIVRLTPGDGCEAFATNVQGKCVGHVLVGCQEQSLRVSTVAGQAELLMTHWDRYLITENVSMRDRSTERGEVLIAGPATHDILARLGLASPPISLYGNCDLDLDGADCWLTRAPFVAVDNYLLSYPRSVEQAIWTALANAGAVVTDAQASRLAFESARIENRFPWFGRDIDDKTLPQEVDRNVQAISFKKGCYLGQETVARIDALGHVNRTLNLVQCTPPTASQILPADGAPLAADGKPVGQITSAVFSPKFETVVALAYLRRESARSGTRLSWPEGEVIVLPQESTAP